jgi:tetratricopeptide (TPR) repeat protein
VATVRVLYNLAMVEQDLGHHEQAAALFRRGLEVRERELPPEDQRLTGWVSHLAQSELELGRLDRARPLLERSLALRARHGESELVMARERLRLARALAPVELPRARELAEQARQAYASKAEQDGAKTSAAIREALAEAEAWLAANPENAGTPE